MLREFVNTFSLDRKVLYVSEPMSIRSGMTSGFFSSGGIQLEGQAHLSFVFNLEPEHLIL